MQGLKAVTQSLPSGESVLLAGRGKWMKLSPASVETSAVTQCIATTMPTNIHQSTDLHEGPG
jgi:hypothetical protein